MPTVPVGSGAVVMASADGPAVLVKGKVAGIATPGTVAMALNAPSVLFAVRMGEVATPLALVGTVVGPDWNDALGPEAGTLNVTCAFGNRFPPTSFTVACRGFGNVDPS